MLKLGRNDPCRCGSGKKYKKCCLSSDTESRSEDLKVMNEQNSLETYVHQDHMLDHLMSAMGVDLDEPTEDSPEFEALNKWVEEYTSRLDEHHPFLKHLQDVQLNHSTLIKMAKEQNFPEFYEPAEVLYDAWQKAYFNEIFEQSVQDTLVPQEQMADCWMDADGDDFDAPEEDSPEYKELNQWVEKYSSQLDEKHPFQKFLQDVRLEHYVLINIAKELNLPDFYKPAEALYRAWLKS